MGGQAVLASSDNPLFPVLPDHESAALALFDGRHVAPTPVRFLPDAPGGAVLVYEYVPGPSWVGDVVAVAELLRRAHGVVPPPGVFRCLATRAADISAHAASIVRGLNVDERLTQAVAVVHGDAPDAPGCLVHTDCGPGNLVEGPAGLRLIDWQCPGVGDPAEDLATFASPAMQILYGYETLHAAAVSVFLDAYDDERVVARFSVCRWPYHARIAAYCAYRADALAAADPAVADRYRTALAAELDLLDTR